MDVSPYYWSVDGIVDDTRVVFVLTIKVDPIVIQYPIKMTTRLFKNENPVSSDECTWISIEGTAALYSDNIPAL